MKFITAFAFMFACLVATSMLIDTVEAGKKKKLLGALLIGAALASKKKIIPIPIPIPIPFKEEKYVSYPEPMPYPVYYGGGGYGGGGYGGGY